MSPQPAPTHLIVYTVENYESEGKQKTEWSKAGVAFPHKNGVGFNIELRNFPRDGRLVVLPPREGERDEEADDLLPRLLR
jgi:hypothetical protein